MMMQKRGENVSDKVGDGEALSSCSAVATWTRAGVEHKENGNGRRWKPSMVACLLLLAISV